MRSACSPGGHSPSWEWPRLELTRGPDNEASQHVAEHCGFSREGLLRSHVPFKGARRDSVIYSLLAGELP
jgi:RimJ/RimL family protein N-acetyltransferase